MKRLVLLGIPVLLAAVVLALLYWPQDATKQDATYSKSKKGPRFEWGQQVDGMQKVNSKWMHKRLAGPDGHIPENIRSKELAFAKTLPSDAADANALTWDHLGPPNVGGRTRGAAVDVTNDDVILAAGVSGGVWRTTDGGQSWQKMTDPDQLHSVTTIVQDKRPGKEHIWYYGTGEGIGNSASGGGAFFLGNGIYKSTDSGKSWQPLGSTVSENTIGFDQNFDLIYRVALNVANDTQTELYAACYGTVLRSTDGGQEWETALGGGSPAAYATDVAITSNGVVYATLSSGGAASERGIWRSENGEDWTRILPDSFPPNYSRIVVGINPHHEDQVYFLAQTPDYGQKTDVFFDETEWSSLWKYEYVSGDGSDSGGKWWNLSENLPADGAPFDNFNPQGGYNLEVAVSPNDSNVVFLGATNVYRSTDGFKSANNTTQIGGYKEGSMNEKWELYAEHHPDQHRFLFLPSQPNALITANDGGMYKTDDAYASNVDWEPLNNSYITTQFYTVTMNQQQATETIIGGFQDNGNFVTRSSDISRPWVMPLNGDGSYAYITEDESDFYLSKQRGKVYKFNLDNEGDSTGYTRIDPAGANNPLFINPYTVDPNDETVMYFPAGKVMWRNDELDALPLNGQDDSITQGWTYFQDTLTDRNITQLAVSASNPPHRLYFGTDQARLYRVDDAHTGQPSPQQLGTKDQNGFPVLFGTKYTSSIAVDPGNADHVLVAYSNYSTYSLFYSRNGGDHWEKVAGNLEQSPDGSGFGPSIRTVEILPVGDDTLYLAGTSVGLFSTTGLNGLDTEWKQIGANTIGNVVVEMVKAREADGQVLVATHGNGLYRTYITNIDQVVGTNELAAVEIPTFTLYPNPATNQIRMDGSTDQWHQATYAILDELGRKVMQGPLPASRAVDVSGLSAGMYYLELRTNEGRVGKGFVKE